MSTLILNGRDVRDALVPELRRKLEALSRMPTLAIIQVGTRPDSSTFIKAKKSFAAKIGVPVKHLELPEGISQQELIGKVQELNADEGIDGIIVQLPLPVAIDQDAVIETIDPRKDVDALTSYHVKRWLEGREDALLPATTRGVKELLEYYKIDLFKKRVVVVGRSMLVGKPMVAFCLNQNATVSVCHSKTADLAAETRRADVLVVAVGKPKLIGAEHVSEGAVVIDIGVDVDFEAVKGVASAITPVPGGVGPMTVLGLFENLADLCAMG